MRDQDVVVEFPTGRPLRSSGAGRRTVAELARRLARSTPPGSRPTTREALAIRLRDLTGISDPTVDTLTALAVRSTLTPACAARLAIRHAAEIGRGPPDRVLPDGSYRHRHELVVSGEAGGRFALRIGDRSGGAWVACAALADLDLLSGVCPAGVGPAMLILGVDPKGRTRVHLKIPRDWRAALRRLGGVHVRPDGRHVVIVGGLPIRGPGRTQLMAGVADGLRRGGACLVSMRAAGWGADPSGERERRARHHLLLIELAVPGLVDLRGSGR